MNGTLVVLPTYDEATNIEAVLRRIRREAPEVHVLVVDDASPDGTAALAGEVGRDIGQVHVLSRGGKQGLGSAYRHGFAWAMDHGFDIVVEMDADLSHDPAAIVSLLDAVAAGHDLVIGSRYVPGGRIPNWAWHRRALSRAGNRYAAALLHLPVLDATSGFRAYRTSLLRRMDLDAVRAEGYGFQIEMTMRAAHLKAAMVEVPISFVDRVRGTSKMSGRIVVEALLLVTAWGLRDRTRALLGPAPRLRAARRAIAPVPAGSSGSVR